MSEEPVQISFIEDEVKPESSSTELAPASPGHPFHASSDRMQEHIEKVLNHSLKDLTDLTQQIEDLKDELIRRAALVKMELADHFTIAVEAASFATRVRGRLGELRRGGNGHDEDPQP